MIQFSIIVKVRESEQDQRKVTTLLLQRCALRTFYGKEDQTARNCHQAVVMTLPRTGESNNTK